MKLWDCFLEKLDKQFGKETIDRWLRSMTVIRFDAANLYLQANDSFQTMWFEEHIRPILKQSFLNNNGRAIKVHLIVGKNAQQGPKQENIEINDTPIRYDSDDLLPYCTFDQYIPSSLNKVPFEVLCKITGYNKDNSRVEAPSMDFLNPIYVYGPSGVGKSHLLMAVAKVFLQRGLKAFYVNAQTFTDHVVSAIRRGDMQTFRETYRHLDLLIIDDIQVLARKNATQEELFHTFNTLHTANKQIVLGANLAPHFIDGIEERLISRFEWGITLPLQKVTEHADLLLALEKRANFYEVKLEKSLSEYIATFFKDARGIIKTLDALIVHAQLNQLIKQDTIHLSMVKDFIDELHEKEKSQKITPDKIIQIVADLFDIKMEDVIGKSQSRDCALPRQIAMYLLRAELKMPYMKIGSVFSRDHSTVMTSVKAITSSLDSKDKEITFYLQDIQRKLLATG
ncbi:MAG: ATP-binding protein [Chlamydiales bacterium]|nr:ATP-binding protein [Chlamydiales bacterium]